MPINTIDQTRCVGCGHCEAVCPMDVIRICEETHKAVIRYRADCMACYFCEIDCPVNAIDVTVEKGRECIAQYA